MANPAHTVDDFPELQPGDILLYGDRSPLSWAIRFRTWSDVSHVEVYAGDILHLGRTVASRSSGVNQYPFRIQGLRRVYRPVVPWDFSKAMAWFESVRGTRYGYTDLLKFYLVDIPTRGLICSEFADLFFRNGNLELFNINYPEGAVCPGDFEKVSSRLLAEIWSWNA